MDVLIDFEYTSLLFILYFLILIFTLASSFARSPVNLINFLKSAFLSKAVTSIFSHNDVNY
jgi:hypothetical protein